MLTAVYSDASRSAESLGSQEANCAAVGVYELAFLLGRHYGKPVQFDFVPMMHQTASGLFLSAQGMEISSIWSPFGAHRLVGLEVNSACFRRFMEELAPTPVAIQDVSPTCTGQVYGISRLNGKDMPPHILANKSCYVDESAARAAWSTTLELVATRVQSR